MKTIDDITTFKCNQCSTIFTPEKDEDFHHCPACDSMDVINEDQEATMEVWQRRGKKYIVNTNSKNGRYLKGDLVEWIEVTSTEHGGEVKVYHEVNGTVVLPFEYLTEYKGES